MSILLLETIHRDAEALLAARTEVRLSQDAEEALAIARSGGVSGILTRGKGKITAELMHTCGPSLKVVARCGAGLDTIDTEVAKQLGLKVVYAPGQNAATAAEHALMLMLAVGRKLTMLNAHVKGGDWAIRDGYEGVELRGKTLGIIGLGNIGQKVAELATAFGMRVSYWSRSSRSRRYQRFEELNDLLAQADFLSVHVALTPQTRLLLDADRLAKTKPGAILINTSRGAVIDQRALSVALALGQLGGFGGDVLDGQPPDPDDPLLKQDTAILTPHVAGLTDSTYRAVCLYCAEGVLEAIRGKQD